MPYNKISHLVLWNDFWFQKGYFTRKCSALLKINKVKILFLIQNLQKIFYRKILMKNVK